MRHGVPIENLSCQFDKMVVFAQYLIETRCEDMNKEAKVKALAAETTVQMNDQPIEGALAVLKDQYAVGTVTAKIIQPIPQE